MIIKAGPVTEAHSPAYPDVTLTAPENPNSGKPYDISHIIFCTGDPFYS